jgi:hypothetical protein
VLATRAARLALLLVAAAVTIASPAVAADPAAPQVVLASPTDGSVYFQGQRVQAAYGCVPGELGWPVVSCTADAPLGDWLDTSAAGTHTFTVTAADYAGAVTTVVATYTVVDVVPPAVTVATPADGAGYPVGAPLFLDFSCEDPGGEGIVGCFASSGDGRSLVEGMPLPTDQVGTFNVTVVGVDAAGHSTTVRHVYQVADTVPPTITIATPRAPLGDQLPVYVLGQQVNADYSCADDAGLTACFGPVAPGAPIDTSTVGVHAFTVEARDRGHNATSLTRRYRVIWDFSGFSAPLVPPPGFAMATAGATLPVKFSLHGDFGLGVVARAETQPVTCDTGVATGAAATAGGTLSYNAGPERYAFQLVTDSTWRNTCRAVRLTLSDGTEHQASVRFSK